MFCLFLVHRCITGKATQCLSENLMTNGAGIPTTWYNLMTNGEMGHRRTQGLNNLFLPQFNSSFKFQGSQDWNSLPSCLKVVNSKNTFESHLKDHIKQQKRARKSN